MLQKVKSYSQLFVAKKSLKTLLKTNRAETVQMMKTYHEALVDNKQLNEDLTEGSVPGQNKLSKQLIKSFTELRDRQHEEDFYTRVATHWVEK